MNILSAAEKKAIAEEFTPEIAWRTVALALALPLIQGSLIFLALNDAIAYWIATPILGLVAYAYYTLIHESIHGNVIRNRQFAWVHTVIGWWGSLNLFYTWPNLRRTHLSHHSHTNTDKDPDARLVGGDFSRLVRLLLLTPLIFILPYFLFEKIDVANYGDPKKTLTKKEYRTHLLVMHALQGGILIAFLSGYALPFILLYLAPALIGTTLLAIFFQWLPHYPFNQTGRYQNARISEWPLADYLLFGQNMHLAHHLWPSAPFYNYRPLYEAIKPHLETKGARIEGLHPSGSLTLGTAE